MYEILKRGFDILVSLTAIVLLSPVLAILAILVKLETSGPIFFRQKRVGRNSRLFDMLKFRKMPHNMSIQGPSVTTQNDVRMTQMGRWMERFKLDELPQFFNVLKGEMSIVGPRPETPNMVEYYTEQQREVLKARPGIFGPNQIEFRCEAELYPQGVDPEVFYRKKIMAQKIENDLNYMAEASLTKDLRITMRAACYTIAEPFSLRHLRHLRFMCLALLADVAMANISLAAALFVKFGSSVPPSMREVLSFAWIYLIAARVGAFLVYKLYQRIWRYTSLTDVLSIIKSVTTSTGVFAVYLFVFNHRDFSVAVLFLDWLLLIGLMVGPRAIVRMHSLGGRMHRRAPNILIFGAGNLGETAVRQLANHPDENAHIVGFLDDDPKKAGKIIHGIKVLGTRYDIPMVSSLYDVQKLLLAIEKIGLQTLTEVSNLCKEADIQYQFVPGMANLEAGVNLLEESRTSQIESLFKQHPAVYDQDRLKASLEDKCVLIYVGSGVLSGKLAARIANFHPKQIVIFGSDESKLLDLKNYFTSLGLIEKTKIAYLLGQPQDRHIVSMLYERFEPDVVLHFGKVQDSKILQTNADEAIHRNIFGVIGMADQAAAHGVGRFILVYRRVMDINDPMGICRLFAEQYLKARQQDVQTQYAVVRLADVLDVPRGPLDILREQIRNGMSVSLSHARMERCYMTQKEAINLILKVVEAEQAEGIWIPEKPASIDFAKLARDLAVIYQKNYPNLAPSIMALERNAPRASCDHALTFGNEKILSQQGSMSGRVMIPPFDHYQLSQEQSRWLRETALAERIEALRRYLTTSKVLSPSV